MKVQFFITTILTTISSLLLLVITQVGLAQVATSTNYQLQSDSINFGGGFSSSTNFQQESTFGEVGTGLGTSTSYNLYAGYQQMQEVYLSMTPPQDVVMDTDIFGISGGVSNGSTSVLVTTDSPAGYSLTITSENEPAMQAPVGTIADYNDGGSPDFTFTTNSGDAHFGYSPSGPDITDPFLDDTATCGAGSDDSLLACWTGLSTSGTIIAQGSGANHPNGATTTVHFRVGLGTGANVIAGVYTATTTLTALPL